MAQITINEISQDYLYNIGSSSFATVALPITAQWGPGFFDAESFGTDEPGMLDHTVWQRFPSTQEGLETFVATYRGPELGYRTYKDYSYHTALTLLSSGYDVLTCRISQGTKAFYHMHEEVVPMTTADAPTPTEFAVGTAYAVGAVVYNRVETVTTNYKCIKAVEAASNIPVTDTTYWEKYTGDVSSIWDAAIEYAKDTLVHVSDDTQIYKALKNTTAGAQVTDETFWEKVNKSGAEDHFICFYAKYPGTFGNNIEVNLRYNEKFHVWNLIVYIINSTGGRVAVENKTFVFELDNVSDTYLHYTEINSQFVDIILSSDWIKDTTPPDFETTTGQLAGAVDVPAYEAPVYEEKKAYVGRKYSSATPPAEPKRLSYGDFVVQTDEEDIPKVYECIKDIDAGTIMIPGQTAGWETYWAVSDKNTAEVGILQKIVKSEDRYGDATCAYTIAIGDFDENTSHDLVHTLYHKEWVYSKAKKVYTLLYDKLSYNPQRVISPWDDQDVNFVLGRTSGYKHTANWPPHIAYEDADASGFIASPLAKALMDVGYLSRCATALIDVPSSMDIDGVEGYAQALEQVNPTEDNGLYPTHSALFAPWGQYTYVSTSRMQPATPSFLALLIQRAQLLNQAAQYEWALPTNRRHGLRIGNMAFDVTKHYLDEWQQSDDVVGVNAIARIPDLGINIWGNSTLKYVAPATYNALQNLSTRYLMNAVKNTVYRCGIAITFQYSNGQAYDKFVAGVVPLLTTMKNVGAIDGFKVRMAQDVDVDGQVKANSVIGTIALIVNGVINDITVDLIALPPQSDLSAI